MHSKHADYSISAGDGQQLRTLPRARDDTRCAVQKGLRGASAAPDV